MWTKNSIVGWILGLAICILLTQPAAGRIVCVDADAIGSNDGSSWQNAYVCLQDALAAARYGDEIRVAQGLYKPDQGPGITPGDRTATFQLKNGVTLKGGYAGFGEPDPDDRDIERYETVLSGDLNSDDIRVKSPRELLDGPTRAENSFHVVTSSGTTNTAILDGFTVSGGNANASDWRSEYAYGGGLYSRHGNQEVRNCTLTENSAFFGGGGMCNLEASNSKLMNCRFVENFSRYDSGAMRNEDSNPTLTDCFFIANRAELKHGGAIDNYTSAPVLNNCLFMRNSSDGTGGALGNLKHSNPNLTNCRFIANIAGMRGPAIDNTTRSNAILYNCTFKGNLGSKAGHAINCTHDASARLVNTILWDGTPYLIGDLIEATYSNVLGPWPSAGNIDADPSLTPDGHLRAGSPCIDVGDPGFGSDPCVPTDIDGENRVLEGRVDIGADEFLDRDSDGLPDWWEQTYFGDPNAADPNDDCDGDGLPNIEEYELYSSNPVALPICVNPSEGPFWTIQQGIDAADDGDTVLVAPGTYTGSNNKNLDFHAKSIVLYAPDGPAVTAIDCEYEGRGFDFDSGETGAVIGFTITNGRADYGGAIRCEFSQPQIRNCVITGNVTTECGGGIYCNLSGPALADCTIGDNNPDGIWMKNGSAWIVGAIHITSNNCFGHNIALYGEGTLDMQSDVMLDFDDSRIRCDISGPGTIQVASGSELIIEADAVIDLGQETGPNGRIVCDGLLRATENASITDARLYVTRASFEDDVIIANCVIDAEAGAPYGQFFIEDNVHISLDRIKADGDRYLDLDPSKFDCNNIQVGVIDINITEGVGGSYGGLFELRGAPDLVTKPLCQPDNPFICQVDTAPDLGCATWTINRLELVRGAKVNLTNRFDFQAPYDSGGDEEVLYVKRLVLGPDSILNTAFHRLYYESLIMAPTARVINVPLLGFSLNNIAFDDENEFLTRIKHNNFQHPENPAYDRAHIERIAGRPPDPAGMMRMCNLRDTDPESPSYQRVVNARAKGLFAKSSEGKLLICFEYLFETSDPGVELVVYLTDVPELMDHGDQDRQNHYIEVARLANPPAGRAGSAGSGRFGVLHEYVWTDNLDFIKGTRIELELIGPDGSCVLINNWDPQVHCNQLYCGDVTGDYGATVLDFLTVVAHVGSEAGLTPEGTGSLACLEFGFSEDGRIDALDVSAWDWRLSLPDPLNLCEVPLARDASTMGLLGSSFAHVGNLHLSAFALSGRPPGELLIAGKRGTSDGAAKLEDCLYNFDDQGQYMCTFNSPSGRANGRLLQDLAGELYQINYEKGLVRLSDGSCVVPPRSYSIAVEPRYNSPAEVSLGLLGEGMDWAGCPILDVAFDADGYLYVVPVVINPIGNDPYYEAAAKLQLLDAQEPPYRVVQLYEDPRPSGDNRRLDSLREVEIDRAGNLYVTNTYNLNDSDLLWVYDADTADLKTRIELGNPNSDCYLPWPGVMHVSKTKGMLYLASSQNDPNADCSSLYAFSADDFSLVKAVTINGMGHVTAMTEDPATGTVWVAGFTMGTIPEYIELYDEPFYQPYLAKIPYGSNGPVEAVGLCNPVLYPDNDLALPLSIAWTATEQEAMNFSDFACFAAYWLESGCTSPGWCSGADFTGDGNVTAEDLRAFCDNWLAGIAR
jgi:hypothetical protein